MNMLSKIRLVMAGMLIAVAVMFAQGVLGNIDPNEKLMKEQAEKQYEYLKKAKYFEIRAKLEAEEITLEQAQAMWHKAMKKLNKKEAK